MFKRKRGGRCRGAFTPSVDGATGRCCMSAPCAMWCVLCCHVVLIAGTQTHFLP